MNRPVHLIVILMIIQWFQILPVFSQVIVSGGPENDIIGRMCRMPSSLEMIAIIERNPDWGSGDLYLSFGGYFGNDWSDLHPVVIKPGNQSTHCVVATPDDSLRVYYASDETGSYKIFTISSADGINWVNDHQLDLGWPSYQSVYDPHVMIDNDSSLTMTYVKLGGGGYVAHCDTINQWDKKKTLVHSGAYRIRICRHPYVGYLAAYHRNMGSNQYDVNVRTSQDLTIWSDEIQITASGNSHDPFCGYVDQEFRMYYATYKYGAYNIFTKSSSDGINWSEEEQITFDNTNNTQPAFFIDLYSESIDLNLIWTHAIDYDTDNDIYFERYDVVSIDNHKNPGAETRIISINNTVQIFTASCNDEVALVQIFTMDGKLLMHKSGEFQNGRGSIITGSLLPGLYIINIVFQEYVYCNKVFLE